MEIKIIADGTTNKDKILGKWGISILINEKVLFDTFGNSDVLMENIAKAKIDITAIQKVVISHNHWDHTEGLIPIAEKNRNIIIYFPPGYNKNLGARLKSLNIKVIEEKAQVELFPDVFKSAVLPFSYKGHNLYEQFLIVRRRGKLNIITGCAHPGIIEILEYVKKRFPEPINSLVGGFHLMNHSDEELEKIVLELKKTKYKYIIPMHCTGENAVRMIKKENGNR
ncbi:MBL fold metallo-hydrolase, partial [Elusimicrobiota bacterium]